VLFLSMPWRRIEEVEVWIHSFFNFEESSLGSPSEEKNLLHLLHESRECVDSIAAVWMVRVSVPRGVRVFSSPKLPRPALGPNQSPIQWVPSFFPWVKVARAPKLTTHLHLVLR
jgi:hypothetical protein